MQAAFKTWLKSCQSDYEDFYSDGETFRDFCDANEMEFYETGRLYDRSGKRG